MRIALLSDRYIAAYLNQNRAIRVRARFRNPKVSSVLSRHSRDHVPRDNDRAAGSNLTAWL